MWPFPDGPRVCPRCGAPTEVTEIRSFRGGLASAKGGGKPSMTMEKKRVCRPCLKIEDERLNRQSAAGEMIDMHEAIAALRENRKPRTQRELHPDQYPKHRPVREE